MMDTVEMEMTQGGLQVVATGLPVAPGRRQGEPFQRELRERPVSALGLVALARMSGHGSHCAASCGLHIICTG